MPFAYFKIATQQDVDYIKSKNSEFSDINVGDYLMANMYDNEVENLVNIDDLSNPKDFDVYDFINVYSHIDDYDMTNPKSIEYELPINGISLQDSNICETLKMRASMSHVCQHHLFTDPEFDLSNYACYRNCSSGYEAAFNICCYEINQKKLNKLDNIGFRQYNKK